MVVVPRQDCVETVCCVVCVCVVLSGGRNVLLSRPCKVVGLEASARKEHRPRHRNPQKRQAPPPKRHQPQHKRMLAIHLWCIWSVLLQKHRGVAAEKCMHTTTMFVVSLRPCPYADCPNIFPPNLVQAHRLLHSSSSARQIRGVGRQFNSQKGLSDRQEVQSIAARLKTPWTSTPASLHEKQRNVCEHSSKALRHEH